jgi:hypothetical protein
MRNPAEEGRRPVEEQLVTTDARIRYRERRPVHGGEAPRQVIGVALVGVGRRAPLAIAKQQVYWSVEDVDGASRGLR